MKAALKLAADTNLSRACRALAVSRASYYRHRRPSAKQPTVRRPRNPRRYSDKERAEILAMLNSERFMDKAPEQIFAILAEEGRYVASARTMYRVLTDAKQVRERRNRRHHPAHTMPRLVARAPNQVWSWDITRLKGPVKGIYFMLYVVIDIFSRYAVGWQLAEHENATLAQHLLRETMRKHAIDPGQLTVHQDRGSPMRAKSTVQMLDDLGIARSYSRPHVSNDNPYSESHFGTLKQRPELPKRLGSLQHGRQIMRDLLGWYNHEHHHSGIRMLTPAQVHYGLADKVLEQRHAVRLSAYKAHPERFINGPPRLEALPNEVWINPPQDESRAEAIHRSANNHKITELGDGVEAHPTTAKPLGLDAVTRLGQPTCEVPVGQ